jgi:hypothetical protein
MEKDNERSFLEVLAGVLVSLPFDLKVLLEAVSDPDLDTEVREIAAAAVVYVISPREGNLEPYLRHSENAILLRLAIKRIGLHGGEAAPAFRDRFAEEFDRFEAELAAFERMCGEEMITWIDGRWGALRKAVYAKKKISAFVEEEEVGTFLYDEGMKFGTNYPISEKSLAGRLKQVQPLLDHLQKKWEQDKRKIPQT